MNPRQREIVRLALAWLQECLPDLTERGTFAHWSQGPPPTPAEVERVKPLLGVAEAAAYHRPVDTDAQEGE